MSIVTIRSIIEDDFKEVIKLIRETNNISYKDVYPDELNKLIGESYTEQTLRERVNGADYFVAENSDKLIIGIIGLKDGEVRTFFVHPEYQGKGAGRLLYDAVENMALKKGLKKLRVTASGVGEPIYEHFGFVKVEVLQKEKAGIHYTNALMEKHL